MTRERSWPNNQKERRDQAAEAAVVAIRLLQPVVAEDLPRGVARRREAQALIALERIALLLLAAGAPIRPEAIYE